MLNLTHAFEGLDLDSLKSFILENGMRPEIGKNIESKFGEIIRDCWAQEPKQRPSFEEMCAKLSAFV